MPEPGRDGPAPDGLARKAFDAARGEVVDEIRRAPSRRVDNVVSRLHDFARRLEVHATVCGAVRRAYDRAKWRGIALVTLVVAATVGLAALLRAALDAPLNVLLAMAGAGAVVAGAIAVFTWINLKSRAEALLDGLDGVFARAFARDLVLGNRRADLEALWRRVRDQTHGAVRTFGPGKTPRLRRADARAIARAVELEIPALRA